MERRAQALDDQIQRELGLMPMSEVLIRLPGKDVRERAKRAAISRATYYHWLRGYSRPGQETARRIARLTGIPMEQFRA